MNDIQSPQFRQENLFSTPKNIVIPTKIWLALRHKSSVLESLVNMIYFDHEIPLEHLRELEKLSFVIPCPADPDYILSIEVLKSFNEAKNA